MTNIDRSQEIFEDIINGDPALRQMASDLSYSLASPRLKFPKGLRWARFGELELFTGIWACCYTTTRNQNGKFVSWIYQPVVGKKQWKMARIMEHVRMKDAKARCYRLWSQHRPIQEKYLALLKKRQKRGRK
jgi:hypothetical protein